MNSFLMEIVKSGNIYILIVAILLFLLYLFIKFFFKDYKNIRKENKKNIDQLDTTFVDNTSKIEKTIIDNDRVFYKKIKEILDGLDKITKDIDKLNSENKDRLKDIEHRQEKITDKVTHNSKIVTEIKDEVVNLKYKVELMLVQKNNSAGINKGL